MVAHMTDNSDMPETPDTPIWSAAAVDPLPVATAESPWPARRRRPSFSHLVAAAGGLLVIFGIVTLLSELADSSSGAGLAAMVAAGVVVGAYLALNVVGDGPIASALVVVSLFGAAVPMPFIVSAQDNPGIKGSATLMLLVPTAVWALLFFAGPARGRLPYLGAALLGLWLLVGVQVVDTGGPGGFAGSSYVSTSAVSGSLSPDGPGPSYVDIQSGEANDGLLVGRATLAGQFEDDGFTGDEGPGFFEQLSPFGFFFGDTPDAVGFVSLLFGVGYLAAAVALERRGARGGATPFVAIGNVALVLSTTLLATQLEDVGTSIYALAVGGSLIWFGAWTLRRFTSWLGVLMLLGGIGGLVSTITDDTVPGGLLLLLAGALTVVAATQVAGPASTVDEDSST
jgi:hypothetical protein